MDPFPQPTLLVLLGEHLIAQQIEPVDTRIELQRLDTDRGFTDIEIISQSACHIIIEAKRYWELPTVEQLKKYAPRIKPSEVCAAVIVSLSAASIEYANGKLPEKIADIALVHRSWGDLSGIVRTAYSQTNSFDEKLWLWELEQHLNGYVSMQDPKDNTVFVVSLSSQAIKEDNPYTWVDVIERDNSYFHPVGNNWPLVPPNYLGFRQQGRLQSVHHIDHYEVINNLADRNPHWPETDQDHYVYTLGPAMRPRAEIRNGKIWPSGRYWCAIDTLLSGAYTTISDARDETNRRVEASDG